MIPRLGIELDQTREVSTVYISLNIMKFPIKAFPPKLKKNVGSVLKLLNMKFVIDLKHRIAALGYFSQGINFQHIFVEKGIVFLTKILNLRVAKASPKAPASISKKI